MELNLTGKVAVVTGASKGIGLAITRALAEEGAFVVAASQKGSPELDLLAERWHVRSMRVDLSIDSGPAALVAHAIDEYEHLDIVVNNVGGVRPRPEGYLAVTDADWTSTFTLNFFAAQRTMRAALPHLLKRNTSSIVTISSVNAFLPDPLVIDYCAAKGALSNLCKALSKEFGPRGVRVNTVSPGPVETDLWLGDGGVADTLAKAQGTAPGGHPGGGRLAVRDRQVHPPARGGRPRPAPLERSHLERHRRRLRHRRRPRHHPLIGLTRRSTHMTKPVVFIHGLWLHATSWQPWIELFASAGYGPSLPAGPTKLRRSRRHATTRMRSPTSASTTSRSTTPGSSPDSTSRRSSSGTPSEGCSPRSSSARASVRRPSPSIRHRSRACSRSRSPSFDPACRRWATRRTCTGSVSLDAEGVPVRVRQRRQRRGVRRAVRPMDDPLAGAPALPGRGRQLRHALAGQGRHGQRRPGDRCCSSRAPRTTPSPTS